MKRGRILPFCRTPFDSPFGNPFGKAFCKEGGAAGFVPTDIANLLTWHDASDLSTITLTSGFVSQWDDKSGNGNHLVQGTGSKRPGSGVESINGLNAIDFDGTNDFLEKTGLSIGPSITIFMVCNIFSSGSKDKSIVSFNAASKDFQIESNSTTQFLGQLDGDNLGDGGNLNSSTDLNNIAQLLVYRLSSGENAMQLRVLGTEEATAIYNGTLGATQEYLVATNRNKDQSIDLHAGEYIIYNRDLALAEILQVEGYLSSKWGT